MAVCTRCTETFPEEARFCPHCGSPREAPVADAEPATAGATPSAADPFSHTAPADPDELARLSDMIATGASARTESEGAIPVRERHFGSTKALSPMEDRRTEAPPKPTSPSRPPPPAPPPREKTMASAKVPSAPPPRLPPPPQRAPSAPDIKPAVPVSPRAATTAQPNVAIPPVGAQVRVLWSDGLAYPATVLQVTPTHCFVQFPNAHTQWFEHRLVMPG